MDSQRIENWSGFFNVLGHMNLAISDLKMVSHPSVKWAMTNLKTTKTRFARVYVELMLAELGYAVDGAVDNLVRMVSRARPSAIMAIIDAEIPVLVSEGVLKRLPDTHVASLKMLDLAEHTPVIPKEERKPNILDDVL